MLLHQPLLGPVIDLDPEPLPQLVPDRVRLLIMTLLLDHEPARQLQVNIIRVPDLVGGV